MNTCFFKAQPSLATKARVEGRSRRTSVTVRAEDLGFCRDKIVVTSGDNRAKEVEGTSTIAFLGADDLRIEVQARKDTYILDSGLDAGLELPFTCRGGICGACVGRVVEGEIDQSDVPDLSFVMSEEEQAQGMTLLCMSRPVTDTVTIETQSDWGYSLGVCEWKGPTGHIGGRKVEPLMGDAWETK